jgi:hypothetical protein
MKLFLYLPLFVYFLARHEASYQDFKDIGHIALKAALSLGLYFPYLATGVLIRCRKNKNQKPETCNMSHGCRWDVKRLKCRMDDRWTLGLKKYWKDRKAHCRDKGESHGPKACKLDPACYWNEYCRARKLDAIRTVHSEPLENRGPYKMDAFHKQNPMPADAHGGAYGPGHPAGAHGGAYGPEILAY